MALKEYHPYSPSLVILDDKRDPSVSWANHIKRTKDKSRGGIDCVAKVGTPVYARTAGRMWQLPNNGSAGNSCEFAHDANPGWRDVFSHLSRYASTENGKWFEAGTVIGYTGNTGGVTEHLHWHLLDPQGRRQNPWSHFTPAAAASSGSSSVAGSSTPLEEIDMDATQDARLKEVHALLTAGQTGVAGQRDYVAPGAINAAVKAIQTDVSAVAWEFASGVEGKRTAGSVVLTAARVKTLVESVDKLAAALSAIKPGAVTNIAGDPIDYERIIQGVADELAKRVQE